MLKAAPGAMELRVGIKTGKPRLADATAARPFADADELLAGQRKSLQRIIHKIRDIAHNEAQEETEAADEKAYVHRLRSRRPRQVFFIDGARGAGKTSLLLTVREYVEFLGDPSQWVTTTDRQATAVSLRRFAHEALKQKRATLPADDAECTSYYASTISVRSERRRVACALDILFPSDLEGGQPVMEGIFAFMHRRLDDEIERLGRSKAGDWNKAVEAARQLKDRLVRKISPGWYLSKAEGGDAIIRDSADYFDYLKKMGDAGVMAFGRVNAFRDFVIDYLKFFNAELLAVFFDDTDVSPSVTRDILHTIRIFLDHPRIVTVLAGHLKSMRQSLLWEYMRDIKEPIEAAAETSGTKATEWRQFQEQQVEEYLEKVLPRQFRNLIRVEHANDLDDRASEESDFKAILGKTFNAYCAEVQNQFLPAFVRGKELAYYNDSIGHLELRDERHRSSLENWIAWYFFRHRYGDQLKPRSVRAKVTMDAMAMPAGDSPALSDKVPSDFRRRLAVFLFENPDNYELIQRFGDTDTRVLRWLRRQHITSRWTGERYFEINGNKIYEDTYSYSFISFRADLGIGMPVRENPDDRIPLGLLGKPSGINLIADRPFFPRMHRQRLHGVAAALRHSVVPANCTYLWDLQCLPDIFWQDDVNPKSNPWGSRLIYEWPNLFVFETSDWSADAHREVSGNKTEITRLKEYLVQVLVPFASIDLGEFTKSQWQLEELQDAKRAVEALSRESDVSMRGKASTLLQDEIDTSKLLQKILDRADIVRRRYDYLEAIGKESQGWSSVSDAAKGLIAEWSELLMNLLLPDTLGPRDAKNQSHRLNRILAGDSGVVEAEKSLAETHGKQPSDEDVNDELEERVKDDREKLAAVLQRHLRSYQWILNDLRKAHHAARIFANDVSSTLRYAESEPGAAGTKPDQVTRVRTRQDLFSKYDRYTVITNKSLLRWVNQAPFLMSEYLGGEPGSEDTPRQIQKAWIENARDIKRVLFDDLCTLYDAKQDTFGRILMGRGNVAKGVYAMANPSDSGSSPAQDLLLPLATSGPQCEDFRSAATKARLSKAYFLFIVALVPCLPALIHIEVASRHWDAAVNGRGMTWADDARKDLEEWRKRVYLFSRFLLRYRRVIEHIKLRLDLMQLCELARGANLGATDDRLPKSLSDFGANLTLAPDISFATLGARGLMHFCDLDQVERARSEVTDEKGLKKKLEETVGIVFEKDPDESANGLHMGKLNELFLEWVSGQSEQEKNKSLVNLTLFDDVIDNLDAAAAFIDYLEKVIEPHKT